MTDEMMRPDEVADWLEVSVDTIYRHIQSGELPALKLGRRYWVPKAEVLAMVRRQGHGEHNAPAEAPEPRDGDQAVGGSRLARNTVCPKPGPTNGLKAQEGCRRG